MTMRCCAGLTIAVTACARVPIPPFMSTRWMTVLSREKIACAGHMDQITIASDAQAENGSDEWVPSEFKHPRSDRCSGEGFRVSATNLAKPVHEVHHQATQHGERH